MSWYNPDWYYTQPPETESEEDYEKKIYLAELEEEGREDD